MSALPSRRYTCAECGRKGRRNNSPDERRRAPVCPSCERQCPRCRDLETALAYSAEGQTLLSKFLQAVKDRDQAQTKIENQAKRIRFLEGATNHACGTPLSIAIRERDEARTLAILLAEAIVSTLEESRHLADGENCTLARLKAAVPDWK